MGGRPNARLGLSLSLALIATAVIAAGCGRTGTSATGVSTGARTGSARTSTRAASVSAAIAARTRFIAAADAICARVSRQIADPAGTALDAKTLARLAPRHARIEKRAVDELAGLKSPATLAPAWRQILQYRQRLATELATLGAAAKANDGVEIKKLGTSKRLIHTRLAAVATRNGFSACAKVTTSSEPQKVQPPASARRGKAA
jgi:hypothetical protein